MAQEAPLAPEAKENDKPIHPKPIVIEPTSEHTATIIWIHGLGMN